ncbi:MAG: FAD-dependent oxidoreductase [Verrucomicrobia bacterium]|nr:FAD-dependent oxidoreductase [Verrucomicrobiota bacterium]
MNASRFFISILIALTTAFTANATTLYLEAERFDNVGGWTIDAQFRQLMGSTYLLAAGTGEPVRDAVTKVTAPEAGKYHLWVRCKDWDKTSPGKFQVIVNGKASATTFGTQKKNWSWIAGGAFDLKKGAATIKLHDLTGYYGRCDALILTTDKSFTPPDDAAGIAALRDSILGKQEPERLKFDFVVVGGGYGGVGTAVQAARLGMKTALIQNRPCLGGNASKEIQVGPGGASPHSSKFRETGICEEIAEGLYQPGMSNWSDAIDLMIKDVPNLTIHFNTEGTRAVMDGKRRIAAVEAEHVVTGKRYRFEAPLFADCTGDGHIAFTAGAEFRVGQESRDEFGEDIAPEKPNKNTMGTSIIHRSHWMPTPQPFKPPPFAVKFTAEHFTKRKLNLVQGTWWIEYGGMIDTIRDAEEIRDELIRVIFGAFDWAKNHDPENREKNANYKLAPVPTVGGKRESRRFIGDYILKQQDLQGATMFPDRVAFGGWPIDLHPSPGIYGKDIPPAIFNHLSKVYSLPYRILYTRDVDNLFLAGRHVSLTHVALGSPRLMQTIGAMGQAVGAAASLCKKYGELPRGINLKHIAELQHLLLRWDAYIPEIANEDAGDLCRGAKVSASSALPDGSLGFFGTEPTPGKDAPMTTARGQKIGTAAPGVNKVSLQLRADGDKPVEAKLHVQEDGKTETLTVTATVKPGGNFKWVSFALPEPLKPGKGYLVWLPVTKGLCWRLCERGGGERMYGKPGAWTVVHGSYVIKPSGTPQKLGRTGPAAAVDGAAWPLGDECHQWRSEPAQKLPQWLEVDFGKPQKLNTVYVTFDTNIYGRFPVSKPGAEVTAEDYRILYNDGGQWKVAHEEKGNWRRFRRHAFGEIVTDKLRLEVMKAKNGAEARLYEIRAYKE